MSTSTVSDAAGLPRAGARPERNRQLRALQESVGEDAVWCLDPWAFEAVWPGYFDALRTLPGRRDLAHYAHGAAVDGLWAPGLSASMTSRRPTPRALA